MAIETDLATIRLHLARIADALEALLAEHGYVPESPTEVKEPTKPAPAKKTTQKKKKENKVTIGKEQKKEAVEYDLKDVRRYLHHLQESTGSQAEVKSLLKKFNATTLGQLDEAKYAAVVNEIVERAGEPDDS